MTLFPCIKLGVFLANTRRESEPSRQRSVWQSKGTWGYVSKLDSLGQAHMYHVWGNLGQTTLGVGQFSICQFAYADTKSTDHVQKIVSSQTVKFCIQLTDHRRGGSWVLPRADFFTKVLPGISDSLRSPHPWLLLALPVPIAQGSVGPDTNSKGCFHPAPFCFVLFSAVESLGNFSSSLL